MIQTAHFQVYAGDFILETHQECSLELFCGKILRLYMKVHVTVYTPDTIPIICNLYDNNQHVFAEVQLLLNLDQFCREHPHSHAGMYCDRSSLVLHTTCEMLVNYVTGNVPPPNVILEWDSMTDTLYRISH